MKICTQEMQVKYMQCIVGNWDFGKFPHPPLLEPELRLTVCIMEIDANTDPITS